MNSFAPLIEQKAEIAESKIINLLQIYMNASKLSQYHEILHAKSADHDLSRSFFRS